MASKHPGFASVQSKIAKQQGISADRAGAILAHSSRHASAKAKRKNPRLKKVGGERRAMAEEAVNRDRTKSTRKLTPAARLRSTK